MKGNKMEMSDRRANLLEAVADSCRREMALEESKREMAAEFNDHIKALKSDRENLLMLLKQLDEGTQELPFDEETEYPKENLDSRVTSSIELDEDGEHAEPDPGDPGPEDDIDPGRFFG